MRQAQKGQDELKSELSISAFNDDGTFVPGRVRLDDVGLKGKKVTGFEYKASSTVPFTERQKEL